MARPLRIEYEGAFYHVTSRGNERKRIFFGKGDYDKFKEYLQEAQDKFGYRLLCYVLMSNHYHLLIETPHFPSEEVCIGASVTNRQIGKLFGDMSYSAVAKAHRRLSVRMSRSRSLKKAISTITTQMSNVKV